MRYAKINPETISVRGPQGKVLTDKSKVYPETLWGAKKFDELVSRGFLILTDAPAVPKTKTVAVANKVAESAPEAELDNEQPAADQKQGSDAEESGNQKKGNKK